MNDFRNKEEIIILIIEAANHLISHSELKTVISLRTMLVILIKHISSLSTSEELKLAIVNCFEIIFLKISSECIEKVYIKENLNLIAQVLWISENILANELSGTLR